MCVSYPTLQILISKEYFINTTVYSTVWNLVLVLVETESTGWWVQLSHIAVHFVCVCVELCTNQQEIL